MKGYRVARIYDGLYKEIEKERKRIADEIGVEISFQMASKIYYEKVIGKY